MPPIACLNGVFSAPEEARVPIDDRGYVFGDGVYETMRSYGGRIWALDRHLLRLEQSLGEVAIPFPDPSMQTLRAWIDEARRRSDLPDSLVYVQVTRGVAPRKHTFASALVPTVLVTVRPVDPVAPEVRAAGVSAITVPDIRWARRDIKCINLLPNVLAKQAAYQAGAFEAILVDPDGIVTEGSSTNVFAVANGDLWTAPADHRILGGVTRDLVLGLAERDRLTIVEDQFTIEWLRAADEVFLSGTTAEVLAIVRLDGEPVGPGVVGPLTRRLYAQFEQCVREGCDGLPLQWPNCPP